MIENRKTARDVMALDARPARGRAIAVAGAAAAALAIAAVGIVGAVTAGATDVQSMHRLYNPNSGEHLYTSDASERDGLVREGWSYEGEGFKALVSGDIPVYRLYNPVAGEHHYTTDAAERDSLVEAGWSDEGIGWHASNPGSDIPVYREYNPNAFANNHNYTTDISEHSALVEAGWRNEGIAFYGASEEYEANAAAQASAAASGEKRTSQSLKGTVWAGKDAAHLLDLNSMGRAEEGGEYRYPVYFIGGSPWSVEHYVNDLGLLREYVDLVIAGTAPDDWWADKPKAVFYGEPGRNPFESLADEVEWAMMRGDRNPGDPVRWLNHDEFRAYVEAMEDPERSAYFSWEIL